MAALANGLFLKHCKICNSTFLTEKAHKQQCPECDKAHRKEYAAERKSWNKSSTNEHPDHVCTVAKLSKVEVCAAAKAEGTTYGKYLLFKKTWLFR